MALARARALAKAEQRTPPAPVTTATFPVKSVFKTFCSNDTILSQCRLAFSQASKSPLR